MLKKLVKSIDIKATPEKVWNVLFTDRTYRIWAGEFSEGSHFEETDWSEGSQVVFSDSSGRGLLGKITKSVPGEALFISYAALYDNGKTDTESPEAKEMSQAQETYTLTQLDDVTTRLDVSMEMLEQWTEGMDSQWDNAMAKIKVLAETAD